ncbi:argininosuccinate synthase [Candidatus Peregrinibacteria bacterium]|nr:MAG: argininosuccinate synthase [Candidatus Peregrinibacteria bacterium]
MNSTNHYQKVASYEARPEEVLKCVLLYSGGLDTSVMLKWIQDEYQCDVIALTIDIGQQADDLDAVKEKALKLGATEAIVLDCKEEFANHYLAKGIKANSSYQGDYHLSTPIGRPLLAQKAVKIAKEYGANAIAHGCTGKGNDQVRLEATALCLDPTIKIIAPVREWSMGRKEEIEYAKKHNIPITHTIEKPYSYDDNMWGISAEGGVIEDPEKIIPLAEVLQVCNTPENAPDQKELITIAFKEGIPVALNGAEKPLIDIVTELNQIGAKHAIGVVVHIEDRLVGLKIRDVYEHPGAHIIIKAHKNLEKIVCTQEENKFKTVIDQEWAHLCYNAQWLAPQMDHLNAYIDSVNKKVSGTVTVSLYKGSVQVEAIKAPRSLFNHAYATFEKNLSFNQNASPGFIEIHSLAMKTAYQMNNHH